ncbi:MAG: carbohydrate-binding protein [Clostridia bacterium]|nr:carbohydrate-binding protein [Clostridia bacterium]
MKKRFFAAVVALAMLLSFMPAAFAASVYSAKYYNARNMQQHYDPYKKTIAANCLGWFDNDGHKNNGGTSTSALIIENDTSFSIGYQYAFIVYENMNFGDVGASSVEIGFAANASYATNLEFYKVDHDKLETVQSATSGIGNTFLASNGVKIAEVKGTDLYDTDGWANWQYKTIEIADPSLLTGTFDLYVKATGKFYNFESFKFHEIPSAYDKSFVTDAAETGNYYLNFGDGGANALVMNYTSAADGEIKIYKDSAEGNLLHTISVPAAAETGSLTADLTAAMNVLSGVNNLYFDFGDISVTSIYFTQSFVDPFYGDDEVNIAYIGASTDTWAADASAAFTSRYEGRELNNNVTNVAVGGSAFGMMKAYDAAQNADMVFVEFAAADTTAAAVYQMESIVKTLASMDNAPYVVIVNTGTENENHEKVAEYYGLPSIAAADIQAAIESTETYVKPEVKAAQLSGLSRIVKGAKAEYTTDGAVDGGKLYLEPGESATAEICGDVVALEQYNSAAGGAYSVTIDGRKLAVKSNYDNDLAAEEIAVGYFDMEMSYKDARTVTITNIGEEGTAIIGELYYNTYEDTNRVEDTSGLKNPYNEIMINTYDIASSTSTGTIAPESDYIGIKGSGHYVGFSDVNFDKGVGKIIMATSLPNSYTAGSIFEIRLDGPTGELIGTIESKHTGGWNVFTDPTEIEVDASIYGVHDVYIKLASLKGSTAGNIRTIQFVADTSADIDDTLTVANASEISADIETYKDVFDNFGTDDYIKYTVDFGEGAEKDLAVVTGAAENSTGTVVLRHGSTSGEVIAEIDIASLASWSEYTPVEGVITEYGKALTGEQDVYVTFTGETGFAAIKSITFSNYKKADSDKLDYTNYHSAYRLVGDHFEGFNNGDAYVSWAGVDFGEESKLRNITIGYGTIKAYQNSYIQVRLDSPTGKIIAFGLVEYQEGINWDVRKEITVPVTADITGVHSIYVTVSTSDYMTSTLAGNIFDLQFAPVSGNVLTDHREIGKKYVDDAWTEPALIRTDLRFIKDSTITASEVMLANALYDAEGNLVSVSIDTVEVADGVNALAVTTPYTDMTEAGSYTLKTMVWDSATNEPIGAQAADTQTITKQ